MIDLPSWAPTADDAWSACLREHLTEHGVTPAIDALGAHLAALDEQRTARGAVKKGWEKTTAKLLADEARPFALAMVRGLTSREPAHDTTDWRDKGMTSAASRSLAIAFVLASGRAGEPSFAADLEHLARHAAALPGLGVRYRDDDIAEAAFRALETLRHEEGVAALCRLHRDIDYVILREKTGRHLLAAAAAAGVPDAVREERSVPRHGMVAGKAVLGGPDTTVYGHYLRSDLEIGPQLTVWLTWYDGDVPDLAVHPFPSPRGFKRTHHADYVEGVRRFAKHVWAEVGTQRGRLREIPAGRTWEYAEWAEHYRDHGLMGALTASLVWEYRVGDDWAAALAGEVPDTAAEVRKWTHGTPDEVAALRERLGDRRQAYPQLP